MKPDNERSASAWLGVAITSMIFMGVHAFMIALSRTPGFNLMFSDQNFFRTALVTHVVLSVVIWFLAYILFVVYYVTAQEPVSGVDYLPPTFALAGIALIVLTPFTGPGLPLLNNYVPVLQRGLYFAGLFIFLLSATAGMAIRAPALARTAVCRAGHPMIITLSLAGAGVALAFGIGCIFLSWFELPGASDSQGATFYYEALFWGGGHVFQFANTMGLMAVWGLLARRMGAGNLVEDKAALFILTVMTAFVLAAPAEYFVASARSMESRIFFTNLKRWGTALGPMILGAAVLMKAGQPCKDPVARRGLLLSIFLFALGGIIALTLHGSDTRVPAHYHGVIGGVTICFMAFAFVYTVENGWLKVSRKWQKAQLTLYAAGQTLLVSGLFIGGYGGLPRKTFGAAQKLDTTIKYIGMGVMGVGELLAVSGGVVFIIFMLKAFIGGRGILVGDKK